MHLLYRITLLLLFTAAILVTSNAQSVEPDDGERDYPTYNNAVYVNYSSLILSNQLSVGVERKLWQRNNLRTKAKVFYNYFLNNDWDFAAGERIYDSHVGLSVVQLISLFEVNAGVAYHTYREAFGIGPASTPVNPKTQHGFGFYGTAGMRFELDKFLLRFGAGNLDHLYIGAGLSF